MKRLLTSAAMFLCSLLTFAQFSGSGSGTEDDPYRITMPIHLNQLRNFLNKPGVYFKMMEDIDLTEFIEDEYTSGGWQPIGTTSSPFKGILDGNGKTISGLFIDRNSTDNVGLFSYVSGVTVKDLNLIVNIKGRKNVGALIGQQNGDNTYSNIVVEGSINGQENVGGLVGEDLIRSNNKFSNITAIVNVKASGNSVGGLVGHAVVSYFTSCKVINSIITGNNYVGGFSGEYGLHSNCIFVGSITGDSYVGGLSGYYSGAYNSCVIGDINATGNYVGGMIGKDISYNISNCYFSGHISGSDYIGGIIGGLFSGGNVIINYANADIKGNKSVGGICGHQNTGTITQCAYLGNMIRATEGNVGRILGSGIAKVGELGTVNENKALNRTIVIKTGVAQEISDDKYNGTGASPTTLKLKATYVAMGWDFTDIWEIQETECYPYFKTQTAPPVITSNVVSGTTAISGKCVSGATIILEIDGVKKEMVSPSSTFVFTVDPLQAGHEVRISAKAEGKEQSYYTTAVVSYLGSGTEADPYQISTAADLSCAYRKGYYKMMNDIDLTNYINQYSPSEGWESIGREGSETIYFDGDGHKVTGLWCNSTRDNTGLFSCFANGYLKNLTVETASGKQVKGGSNTGILIGKMINGTIENCRVSGNLTDGTPVGGIVGLLDGGKILLSKASVTINTTEDDTYVGGLVGDITSGEIDQCVTLGSITATGKNSQVGGLVGRNAATVTNCYSNADVNSAYCAAGLIAYNMGLVEKCYAVGNISSQNYGAGVIGYNDGENAIIRYCAAMSQIIDVRFESQSAQSGGYGQRILGGFKNGAPDPEMNNYAWKSMQLSVNELPQKVSDDVMNGTAKKGVDLMTASTYQGLGWDFTDMWNIVEGEKYPYLRNNVAEVKKAERIIPTVVVPFAIDGLAYTGASQALVSSGSTTVGDMYYSLDGTNYKKSVPTGIDANIYKVYYKVVDDEYNVESNQGYVNSTIDAKLLSEPTVTLNETQYAYDGTAKEPLITIKDGDVTISSSDYVVDYSDNTNVGTATVTILTQPGKNYRFPSGGITANFVIFREMINLFSESDLWTGYIAQEDLALPSGISAYSISSLNGTSAIATSLSYIPKKLPVLLKRDNASDNIFSANAGTGIEPATNLLVSYETDKTVSDQEGYILYKDEFVLVKAGILPSGRLFLPASNTNRAGTRSIVIEGDNSTAIEGVVPEANAIEEQWYDLQGRKIAKAFVKKGIYILNGRKVLVK